jgi:hypothetical protein
MFDVVSRFGLLALLGFLAVLLAFLVLYLVRLPLLLTLWLLTALLRGLDWFLSRRLTGTGVPA